MGTPGGRRDPCGGEPKDDRNGPVYMNWMLHRTIPLLAALALLPTVPASAEEPQASPPSKQAAPDRTGDRSPRTPAPRSAPGSDENESEKAKPLPPAKKKGGPPPAPSAEAKAETAPAKPAAEGEKPCVPVKPCSID